MTPEATGRRVEEVLDRLIAAGDSSATAAAEELVRALMDFYGAGLTRIMALLSKPDGKALDPLLDDDVVTALLVLHGLHPQDVAARIVRGLKAAGAADAEVTGFEESTGTLRLALPAGDGCGCRSTGAAVRGRVETALSCYAPEVTAVEYEEATGGEREPVLLQIGSRPAGAP